jgi:sugar/nucleoside kinase (ribokinase family)
MREFDVIGVGLSALDYLGIIDQYPPPADVKIQMSEFTKQGGGPVATALVALARLGANVAFVGKMGDDDSGNFMKSELEKENVDVSHVVIEPGGISQPAFIVVDKNTGGRTIFWSESNISPLRASEIDRDFVTSGRILHLDGLQMEAGIIAARWARESGMTVVLDGDTIRHGIDGLIALTHVLIASKNFAEKLTGEKDPKKAMQNMRSMGPDIVGITLGEDGCILSWDDKTLHKTGFKVDVVDTTGAGDVFHGAFIYGLLRDWSIERTADFANAVAAMKCRKLGGRSGIPTLDEVIKFMSV